jgi:hypothetical protein
MATVTHIIEKIRELARSAKQLDSVLDKQHGIDRTLGVDIYDEKFVARRYATNIAEDEMEEYLNTLDIEVLRRIQAVMYSGRQGAAAAVDERDVLRANSPTTEDVVRTIMEKRMNFDVYFDRGLERAEAEGVDLDTF